MADEVEQKPTENPEGGDQGSSPTGPQSADTEESPVPATTSENPAAENETAPAEQEQAPEAEAGEGGEVDNAETCGEDREKEPETEQSPDKEPEDGKGEGETETQDVCEKEEEKEPGAQEEQEEAAPTEGEEKGTTSPSGEPEGAVQGTNEDGTERADGELPEEPSSKQSTPREAGSKEELDAREEDAEKGEGDVETETAGEEAGTEQAVATEAEGTEEEPSPSADVGSSGEKPEGEEEKSADVEATECETEPESMQQEVAIEEQPQDEMYNREALLEQYHQAMATRATILKQNMKAQQSIVMHLRKKKTDERAPEHTRNVYEQEQRYIRFMGQAEKLFWQTVKEKERYQEMFAEMQQNCDGQRQAVELENWVLQELKKDVALNSSFCRSGRPISPTEIEQYLSTSSKKEGEVMAMRMGNIKFKYKILKREQQLKSKEELGKGLHLIDFEQLRVENQSLNEKIEERNEELRKLRRKISNTVHVMTHLKEKMQFVKADNIVHMGCLQDVEGKLSQKRDVLTHIKQARDSLRVDNARLRQKSGLLNDRALLRDYEEMEDDYTKMRTRLQQLHGHHTELTLSIRHMRRKIEAARSESLVVDG